MIRHVPKAKCSLCSKEKEAIELTVNGEKKTFCWSDFKKLLKANLLFLDDKPKV